MTLTEEDKIIHCDSSLMDIKKKRLEIEKKTI